MQHYYHSVRLDMDKCKGCTTCLKRCPTEAIRIRNNRASILNERCIDCGECIKVCANHAKVAVTDPLESIKRFKYPIALPAPTLYAQFQGVHQPEPIIASLFRLGFVDVFEVARAAEIVSYAISRAMREEDRPKPVISSACPAILRLIQVSFPALLDNVIDFISPMEAAAKIAKEEYAQKHGVDKADVGVFFITPCAAKMTAVKSPVGQEKSHVDGVIAIKDVYAQMRAAMKQGFSPLEIDRASVVGIKWAIPGGEVEAVGIKSSLCVDGIDNVINVLYVPDSANLPDDIEVPTDTTPPSDATQPDDTTPPDDSENGADAGDQPADGSGADKPADDSSADKPADTPSADGSATPSLPNDTTFDKDEIEGVLPDDVKDEVVKDFIESGDAQDKTEITEEMIENPVSKSDADYVKNVYETGLKEGEKLAQTGDLVPLAIIASIALGAAAAGAIAFIMNRRAKR